MTDKFTEFNSRFSKLNQGRFIICVLLSESSVVTRMIRHNYTCCHVRSFKDLRYQFSKRYDTDAMVAFFLDIAIDIAIDTLTSLT